MPITTPTTFPTNPELAYFELSGPRDEPPPPPLDPGPDVQLAQQLEAADTAASTESALAPGQTAATCPLKAKYVIRVMVVGEDDAPLEGVAVELRKSDTEVMTATTDAEGGVVFLGVEKAQHQLALPSLDRDAWDVAKSDDMPAAQATCDNHATWAAPAAATAPAAETHVVEQGECISTLAFTRGFAPDTIWNDAGNAALKKKTTKNVLNPGDEVHIPARRAGTKPVYAGTRCVVRRKGFPETFRVRFLDADGKPRSGIKYLFKVTSADGDEETLGTIGSDGYVVHRVPVDATKITVTMGHSTAREVHEFLPATLDPLDTISGVQKRLKNLGYDCGTEDGEVGGMTARALRDFQGDALIDVTGKIDDDTRAALKAGYLT